MDGLRPDYGVGRPASLTWTHAQWLDVLAQSPVNLPLLASQARNWTQALLCQYLQLYHQIEVTQATVAKHLRQAGFVGDAPSCGFTHLTPLLGQTATH